MLKVFDSARWKVFDSVRWVEPWDVLWEERSEQRWVEMVQHLATHSVGESDDRMAKKSGRMKDYLRGLA